MSDIPQNQPDDIQPDSFQDPAVNIPQKDWVMTSESLEELLRWLDQERDSGGNRYEQIRSRLIRIFLYRGFVEAEEMADETFNRVCRKVPRLKAHYKGDPFHYFKKVADFICMEYGKKKTDQLPEVLPDWKEEVDESEPVHSCLDRCMNEKLSPEEHFMVIQYFEGEGHEKIVNRKKLAEKLGITMNTLRIRMHRHCQTLKKCVDNCLEREMDLQLS